MIFCSNPVNGGTAAVMAQTVNGLKNNKNFKIFPCVNAGNNVEIYKTLPEINYLNVKSEEQALGPLSQNVGIVKRVFRRFYRNIKYSKYVKQNIQTFINFIKENSISSVLIHNGGYGGDDLCNQLLHAASKVVMKHCIMVLHNDFCKTKVGMIRFAKYDAQISKWATELVTVSQFTRKRILDNSFIKKDLKVIYNGLPEKRTLSDEQKESVMPLDKNICNIGMIGNFQSNKGQLYLLETFNKLKKRYNEKVVLSIIGNIYEQEYFEKCKEYIKNNNLTDAVNIYHNIYNAAEYCSLFDFMVVPSLWDESFGLTACEALIAGKPCIVTATGGLTEVVQDNVDGFVVPINNSDYFANKMQELCSNEELRNKMGKNARINYEEKFTLDKMIQNYANILS
jgi:glycosyltransferase involved in cell wall biosynthesis